MPRGTNKNFADIFEDELAKPKKHKGRGRELHNKRNECLIDRYYYYGKFEKLRYSIILETLSTQFFISHITISEIIDDNYQQLLDLKKKEPSIVYFKKKWLHLNW